MVFAFLVIRGKRPSWQGPSDNLGWGEASGKMKSIKGVAVGGPSSAIYGEP